MTATMTAAKLTGLPDVRRIISLWHVQGRTMKLSEPEVHMSDEHTSASRARSKDGPLDSTDSTGLLESTDSTDKPCSIC